MNSKEMLEASDDKILHELALHGTADPPSIVVQMAIHTRNFQKLTDSITAASKAGRFLAWFVALAAAVQGVIAGINLYTGCR
jgi:hypothetical protein